MKSLDAINPAFNAVKKLLFPIKLKSWFKLGFISIFGSRTSGAGSGGNFSNATNTIENNKTPDFNVFLAQYGLIIGLIVFFIIVVGLIFGYIKSVFSFVFLEDLIEKKDSILSSFGKNSKNGFSYFVFSLFLGLISLITLILFMLPALIPVLSGMDLFIAVISGITFFLIWFFTIGLIIGIISGFTWDFVLPLMYLKNKGLMLSWSELKKLVFREWKEFLVYIIISFFLSIVGSVIALILLIPLIIIALILLVIGVIFGLLSILSSGNLAIIAVMLLIAFLGILLFVFLAAVITLPITSFFRYYPIIFLGKIDAETSKLLELKGIQLN
jgi:hypothetical protein